MKPFSPTVETKTASTESSERKKIRRDRRRILGKQRTGAYAVEFAICATVFFTCIFACFELARYVYVRQAIDQTAYDACREGIVSGAKVSDVTARANTLLAAYGVSVAGIVVEPETIDDETLEVSVTITCDFAENTWILPEFVTNNDMSSTITLDHENRSYLKDEEAAEDSSLNDNDEPQDV